jgi:uncharacterized protein YjiK
MFPFAPFSAILAGARQMPDSHAPGIHKKTSRGDRRLPSLAETRMDTREMPMSTPDSFMPASSGKDGPPAKRKHVRVLAGAALLAVVSLLGATLWYYRAIPLLWYWNGIPGDAPRTLRPGEYRVTVEALPLAGLENASSMSYNNETGTLFTTLNRPPHIVELSREGEVLRRIPVAGVDDLEGISHVAGNLFVVIDERLQQIYRVTLAADTARIDVTNAPRLGLGLFQSGNLGFEGVTWDEKHHRLFVAKEKPPRVFEIDGLPRLMEGQGANLQIREWQPRQAFWRFLRDLSSLSRHDGSGHMFLLSDESKMLAEYDANDELVGLMPLWRGFHGLTASVPQAEGVAIGRDGTIYLISEPNLFYRFERRKRGA